MKNTCMMKKHVLVIVFLCVAFSFINAKDSKRLLLNDPEVLSARITKLETALQQMETGYHQQQLEIQNLKALVETHDIGSTYIRWARKQCPYNNTELVYSGYAGGGHYNEPGSSAEPVCLPTDPDYHKTSAPDYGRIYGAEFDDNFFHPKGDSEDVPCAVCRVKTASSVIMIPGKNVCYSGWTLEYYGYLASNWYNAKAAGTYVCIDINPEFLPGGAATNYGKRLVSVVGKCGSLQCPPYENNYPLTCVVCSK